MLGKLSSAGCTAPHSFPMQRSGARAGTKHFAGCSISPGSMLVFFVKLLFIRALESKYM